LFNVLNLLTKRLVFPYNDGALPYAMQQEQFEVQK